MGRLSDLLPEVEYVEIGRKKGTDEYFIEWKFNFIGEFDSDVCNAIADDAMIMLWFDEKGGFTFKGNDCKVVNEGGVVTVTCHELIPNGDGVVCGVWIDDDVFCDLYEEYTIFPSIDIYLGEYAKKMAEACGIS